MMSARYFNHEEHEGHEEFQLIRKLPIICYCVEMVMIGSWVDEMVSSLLTNGVAMRHDGKRNTSISHKKGERRP
jgi:hypothetical protein